MMTASRALSPQLLRVLAEAIRWGEVSADKGRFTNLCRGVSELSKLFTGQMPIRCRDYMANGQLLHAYQAYFLPVNLAKVQALLDEMPAPGAAPPPLRVLDVGSGPGTGTMAVLDWFHRTNGGRSIAVTAVDRAAVLPHVQVLWATYLNSVPSTESCLSTADVDLQRRGWQAAHLEKEYDLIVVANVLHELYAERRDAVPARAEFLAELLARLDLGGTLIILEPALRETTRQLHRVRDLLMEREAATIFSPCPHRGPCSALLREDDWCHEERPWLPPTWVTRIDEEVGFIKDALKFSYLILRKDGKTQIPPGPSVYRVVSDVRKLKGDTRAWLCHQSGRLEVGRLNRDRSDANAEFDEWHRGAMVTFEDVPWKESEPGRRTGRLSKTTGVRVIRPRT